MGGYGRFPARERVLAHGNVARVDDADALVAYVQHLGQPCERAALRLAGVVTGAQAHVGEERVEPRAGRGELLRLRCASRLERDGRGWGFGLGIAHDQSPGVEGRQRNNARSRNVNVTADRLPLADCAKWRY